MDFEKFIEDNYDFSHGCTPQQIFHVFSEYDKQQKEIRSNAVLQRLKGILGGVSCGATAGDIYDAIASELRY